MFFIFVDGFATKRHFKIFEHNTVDDWVLNAPLRNLMRCYAFLFTVMKLLSNNNLISSLELVEQINLFRKEDRKSDLLHKTMLEIIRDEFEEEISRQEILPSEYRSERGQTYPKFDLTISQAKQVLVRESKMVRKAVISFLEKIESQIADTKPKEFTTKELLLLQLETIERAEKAENKVLELQPKADFYDAVTESEDTIDLGTAAKVLNLGYGRTTLFSKLRAARILMAKNQPYQKYIDEGLFRVIETKFTKPDGTTHIYIKTLVLQKGLDFIRRKLAA